MCACVCVFVCVCVCVVYEVYHAHDALDKCTLFFEQLYDGVMFSCQLLALCMVSFAWHGVLCTPSHCHSSRHFQYNNNFPPVTSLGNFPLLTYLRNIPNASTDIYCVMYRVLFTACMVCCLPQRTFPPFSNLANPPHSERGPPALPTAWPL
jgi:hypothetical protein